MAIDIDVLKDIAEAKKYVRCTESLVETRGYLPGSIIIKYRGCGSVFDINTGRVVADYNPGEVYDLKGGFDCIHEPTDDGRVESQTSFNPNDKAFNRWKKTREVK